MWELQLKLDIIGQKPILDVIGLLPVTNLMTKEIKVL